MAQTAYIHGRRLGREGPDLRTIVKKEWSEFYKDFNKGFLKGRKEKAKMLASFENLLKKGC